MFDKIRNYLDDNKFKLTLYDNKIYISNYKEVIILTENRITIDIFDKLLIIKGENLVLSKILNKELLITATKIYSIEEIYDQ